MVAGNPKDGYRIGLPELVQIINIPIQKHPSNSCGSSGTGDLGQRRPAYRFQNDPIRTGVGAAEARVRQPQLGFPAVFAAAGVGWCSNIVGFG